MRDNVLATLDSYVVASKVVEADGKISYEEVVFSHENPKYRDVSMAEAIEASSSFPYVFAHKEINGELFTDGGLVNNIPVEIFDGPHGEINKNALALISNFVPDPNQPAAERSNEAFEKIVRIRNQIPFVKDWNPNETQEIFAAHMAEELTDEHDTSRTLSVNVPIDYTNFNLTREQKLNGMELGEQRAESAMQSNCVQQLADVIKNCQQADATMTAEERQRFSNQVSDSTHPAHRPKTDCNYRS